MMKKILTGLLAVSFFSAANAAQSEIHCLGWMREHKVATSFLVCGVATAAVALTVGKQLYRRLYGADSAAERVEYFGAPDTTTARRVVWADHDGGRLAEEREFYCDDPPSRVR